VTLVDETLAIIERNWHGTIPDDVELINRNDSTDRDGNRSITDDPAKVIPIDAWFRDDDESRGGRGVTERERVIQIRVRGDHHGENFGMFASDAEFEALVDDVKEALRAENESPPPTVEPHSETWVEYQITGGTGQSNLYHDRYNAVINVTWEGHT